MGAKELLFHQQTTKCLYIIQLEQTTTKMRLKEPPTKMISSYILRVFSITSKAKIEQLFVISKRMVSRAMAGRFRINRRAAR